jgi:hypothetical protein
MFTKVTRNGYVNGICFSAHILHLQNYVFNVLTLNLILREAFLVGEVAKLKNTFYRPGFKWVPFNLVSELAIIQIEPSDTY